MAQISRPFQIGLVVVVLLAGVWLFALRGPSSSSSSSSTATSTPVVTSSVSPSSSPARHGGKHTPTAPSTASVEAAHAAAPTPVVHSSAPGVEGLTRAIAKAHEAVAISQQNANQLQDKSRAASNEAPSTQPTPATPAGTSGSATGSSTATHAGTTAATSLPTRASNTTSTAGKGSSARSAASALAVPSGQREVEAELKQGKIVVLLFWNPAGSDDVVDHNELQLLLKVHRSASKAKAEEVRHADKFFGLELDKKIAVHEAQPSQVISYGSITRGIQIYGTPTLLVINPHGHVITLTGITDAYSIEQAIEEARASA